MAKKQANKFGLPTKSKRVERKVKATTPGAHK